jgi:uncharacterized protein (TIGR03032 family)
MPPVTRQTAVPTRGKVAPQALGASPLTLMPSSGFTTWLAEQDLSLAFTTYQAGKLFLIGLQPDGRLSVAERSYKRCMGLCAAGDGLWMSTQTQLWRFENTLRAGQDYQGYDKLYVPRLAYTTGDLDLHDVAVTRDGELVFVNTLFNCLGTYSIEHSFIPLWRPPFITQLVPEDRCHLNGLALRDGRAAYVSAVSDSDSANGWRDRRRDGGVVIDIATNTVIGRGLSMPHSPRWYRGRLWLLDSGRGRFGWLDLDSGRFEGVAFCPGYLRGMSFHGDHAIVGLSRPRHGHAFSDLPLDQALARHKTTARCGLRVINLRSGAVEHQLGIEGVVEELYDVVALPSVRKPLALGFHGDELRRLITLGPERCLT